MTKIYQKQLVINNNLINYLEKRSLDSNLDLIFLHGWRSDSKVFMEVINSLNDQKWNIFALDLPGFGQSVSIQKELNLSDYCGVVEEFKRKISFK